MNGGEGTHEVTPLIAAAHELKAPLALVRQIALALEDETLPASERRRLINRVVLTSERALRLTSDLTRSARLDPLLFVLEPVNPEQVCRDVAAELMPLFRAYGRKVVVKPRRGSTLLVANRDLLRRILLNFTDNALHYSSHDSSVELHIRTGKEPGTIQVGVRDFGPALSNDTWRALQAKLRTAPQAVHARPESSGLGLYIASQFAEVMNGRIGAIRHRNGATFYVELQASSQLSLL